MKKIVLLLGLLIPLSMWGQYKPSSSVTTTPLTSGRVLALLDLASVTHINTDPGTKIPFTGTIYTNGMTTNAGSITPSQTAKYRADWLCMSPSTEFLADGIFHVVQNGVSVGQVSYNMNEASAVNQCAGFIDVDLVAGQEVSLHYRTRHTTTDGIGWDRGSYFQLTQLPSAVAPVIEVGTTGIPNSPSSTLQAIAITNRATGGQIGSAATTVNINSAFNVSQTTTGQILILPNPTAGVPSRLVSVSNTGSASFTMYGNIISVGESRLFVWTGVAWNIIP